MVMADLQKKVDDVIPPFHHPLEFSLSVPPFQSLLFPASQDRPLRDGSSK